jgi:hypothetical protein
MPKILLTPYEDDWYPPAKMVDLADPLHEGSAMI